MSFADRRAANVAAHNQSLSQISAKKLLPLPKPAPKKKPAAARVKREPVKRETVRPTRQSSRLAGLGADSEVLKRKAEIDAEVETEKAKLKKMRVGGDLALADIQVEGKKWEGGLDQMRKLGLGVPVRGAQPGVRTFTEEDVKETTNRDLKELRLRMSGLKLYEKFPVNDIKIVPQRVYSLTLHPTEDKPLIFAGDKEGALGIFDASQEIPEVDDDDEEQEETPEPIITALNIHRRTISSLHISPSDANVLYSASYDSSIRALDLAKDVAREVYSPADADEDMPISAIDIPSQEPSIILFTTLDGRLGRHDTRTVIHEAQTWSLTDYKIGGFSIHPKQPSLIATASLDRYMRIWDLRMMTVSGDINKAIIGEHASRLSVSHAAWSQAGHIATSSYDDRIKIHYFPDAASWKKGHKLSEEDLEPIQIPHNNQTGRWVTILKPQWQRNPRDGLQKLCIGNMNRFVDVYSSNGEQLAQLGGDGITAVPAVAQFHPTMDWVAGGNASGKLCLWQ